MQADPKNSIKQTVGRLLISLGRSLSVFNPLIALPAYFRLRNDIFNRMPWTVLNLHPLVTPYLPGERLPENGYTSAMIQASGFNLIVHRQAQQDGSDDSFSVASPWYPEKTFPLGVTEAAVLELEGTESALKIKRYDNLSDVDQSLQNLSTLLRRRLSCELFPETKVVIERILAE